MKIKGVEFGKAPKAAAVITGSVDTRTVRKALKEGADLLEVRVDTFSSLDLPFLIESFKKLKDLTSTGSGRSIPVLLTVRSAREGGRQVIPEEVRAEIFSSLITYSDMIDIELSSRGIIKNVVDSAKRARRKVIVSYHNFKATPVASRLNDTVKEGRSAGADIVKIAAMAKSGSDLKRLAGLLIGSSNLIVIAMGEAGAPSRVFFPFLGSLITYGSVGDATAPGQLSLKDLIGELRHYTSGI